MNPLSRRSILAAGLGLVAGCSTTKTFAGRTGTTTTSLATDGSPPPRRHLDVTSVAMVGDSITAASDRALGEAFTKAGIDDVTIDGETSRRIENGNGKNGHTLSGIRAVQALLDDGASPSVWVVALGTNDVGLFGTPQECAKLIEKLSVLLPPPVPLVWVNVYRSSNLRQTRVFNEVLRGVLGTRGDAVVADWYAIAADPELDVLRSDHLHPNDDGKIAFAELVVQAVQRL